ncbi:MAG TPA: SDR family oxidoreductase [Thermoanaerobaculia bacterium]|nr:SDR family oxidoreductase [Thermoanaerobaculia bacterium]
MELQLKGKTGIITGASRGIGEAIARELSGEGMRLVLVARSEESLRAVAASLPSEAIPLALDLRQPNAADAVIAAAVERFGGLDLLVNNAGATKRGDFLSLTEDDWQDGFALKFFGAMRCARAAWPHLMKSRGAIINVVGMGGRTGSADFAIGGSVNAALLNLTKVLADRGVRDGVRVNAVNPSSIRTDRLNERVQKVARDRGIDVEAAASEMASAMSIARFGEPAEIAAVVAFLASPRSAYCHGAIVDVDGGLTRTL